MSPLGYLKQTEQLEEAGPNNLRTRAPRMTNMGNDTIAIETMQLRTLNASKRLGPLLETLGRNPLL